MTPNPHTRPAVSLDSDARQTDGCAFDADPCCPDSQPCLSVPGATLNLPTMKGLAMHTEPTPDFASMSTRGLGVALFELTNALTRKVGDDEALRRLQRHGIASMDELDGELTELLTEARESVSPARR